FTDLLARVVDVCREPETIVDLGCGPGHLSAVLRRNWPHAEIVGVDSSPAMIEQARRRGGGDDGCEKVTYERADLAVWDPGRPIDLVVSNAALQWVPNQQQVLLRLRGILAPGGTLASVSRATWPSRATCCSAISPDAPRTRPTPTACRAGST